MSQVGELSSYTVIDESSRASGRHIPVNAWVAGVYQPVYLRTQDEQQQMTDAMARALGVPADMLYGRADIAAPSGVYAWSNYTEKKCQHCGCASVDYVKSLNTYICNSCQSVVVDADK